jgi:hypothetical protein
MARDGGHTVSAGRSAELSGRRGQPFSLRAAGDGPAHGEPRRNSPSTVVGSISNSFDDEPDGFTARLSATLPATCGPEVIEQHLQHFAVEFRNWILTAAAERAAAAKSAGKACATHA